MSRFPETVVSFWRETFLSGQVLYRSDTLCIAADPRMAAGRRLMLMETTDNRTMAVLTPTLADQLGLPGRRDLNPGMLRQMLDVEKIALHGADHVFHFTEAQQDALLGEAPPSTVRQLGVADASLFAAFQASAPAQDLDDAYVELDHWAVFGAFVDDRLVCAASMYPWENQRIADVGVLSLPAFRGQGHARRVVRAISRHACMRGYVPQYRCQLDNAASIGLARSAGLSLFGAWDVALAPT